MSNVQVTRVAHDDWMVWCKEHDAQVYAPQWELAYEAALGHVCMYHPLSPRCDHEFGGIDPATNEHFCWRCGMGLPLIPEPPF